MDRPNGPRGAKADNAATREPSPTAAVKTRRVQWQRTSPWPAAARRQAWCVTVDRWGRQLGHAGLVSPVEHPELLDRFE